MRCIYNIIYIYIYVCMCIRYTQNGGPTKDAHLAKLYVEQENYEKAIQTYKILILKFPEKNSYFASAIKKLKKLK